MRLKLNTMLALIALMAWVTACAVVSDKPAEEAQQAYIEYIGHASFRFVAEDGAQIVTDPYNGRIWLGYEYPRGLDADAVLITHPHFDHDADYYFADNTPVYRDPKSFEVGPIKVRGVATEHGFADNIRSSGKLPTNTAWIIEMSGKRFVHFGDSRAVTPEELAAIGPVDVIIGTPEQAQLEPLEANHYIANHYRLPEVSETGGQGMSEVDEMLAEAPGVTRLESNRLNIEDLEGAEQWIVFQPMPGLQAWPENRIQAREKLNQAGSAVRAEPSDFEAAERYLDEAIALDPGELSFYSTQAVIYDRLGKSDDEKIALLERGLANAEYPDWGQAYDIHSQLAELYVGINDTQNARRHYEYIIEQPQAYGVPAYEAAKAFLL